MLPFVPALIVMDGTRIRHGNKCTGINRIHVLCKSFPKLVLLPNISQTNAVYWQFIMATALNCQGEHQVGCQEENEQTARVRNGMGGFRDRLLLFLWYGLNVHKKSNKHLSDSSCHSWMFFPRILSKLLLRIESQTHPSISFRFDLEKHPIKYSKLREQPQNHQWVRIGNDTPCKSQWSWGMETNGFRRNVCFFSRWVSVGTRSVSLGNKGAILQGFPQEMTPWIQQ